MSQEYPIGTPGTPWGEAEKSAWRATQNIKRSYREQVLDKIYALKTAFECRRYGALSYDPERYPLLALQSESPQADKPGYWSLAGSTVMKPVAFKVRCSFWSRKPNVIKRSSISWSFPVSALGDTKSSTVGILWLSIPTVPSLNPARQKSLPH